MPYIPIESERDRLDPIINRLVDEVKAIDAEQRIHVGAGYQDNTGGRLNYSFCEILLKCWDFDVAPKYIKLEKINGTLLNVILEIYRRVGGPYENTAIDRNEDIGTFKRFAEWLRSRLPCSTSKRGR